MTIPIPLPASIAVQAHAPSHLSYILLRLAKRYPLFKRAFLVSLSSSAKMFSINSLSLSVLICR